MSSRDDEPMSAAAVGGSKKGKAAAVPNFNDLIKERERLTVLGAVL
jgi:hypothetical protein